MFKVLVRLLLLITFCCSAQARPPLGGWYYFGTGLDDPSFMSSDPLVVAKKICQPSNMYVGFDHYDEKTQNVSCLVYADKAHPELGTMSYGAGFITYQYRCPGGNQNVSSTTECFEGPEKEPECPCYGNPVKFGSKEKVQFEEDYRSRTGLEFVRYYSSRLQADQGTLGYSWRHSYSKSLTIRKYDSSSTYIYQWRAQPDGTGTWGNDWGGFTAGKQSANIVNPVGYGLFFTSSDGGSTWNADNDIKAKLQVSAIDPATNAPVQWQLTLENGDVEIYDASGRLAEIRYLRGRKLDLTYSIPANPTDMGSIRGVLTDVKNDLGQALHFTYSEEARLATLTDPAGNVYQYGYGGKIPTLTSVIYPGGGHREYYYDEPDSVNSQTSAWQYLTGIADEITPGNLVRTGTYKYNNKGWPISTARANNIGKYIFDYTTGSVTDPLGAVRTYHFGYENRRLVLSDETQTYGTVSRSATYYYDVNGNRKIAYDFKGQFIFKEFDLTRNLELTSTDAYDSPYSRKTSTSWHPTFPLPVTVAEPKRITRYTYDSVGNMLTKSVQATTDASGFQGLNATPTGLVQTWVYTYNLAGQVLTAKGPRTDVNDTTIFTYDTAGNLTSIVNAAGHTTTLSNYDANGRPGIIVNPNGDTITMAYAPRGWLISRTVTADGRNETTNYDYDGVGNVIKVTLPDGSAVNYGYDDASRLTSVSDSLGNRIDYTLDGLGNRTAERTRDLNGTLSRQITRVFDNLGRMTQQTGVVQ